MASYGHWGQQTNLQQLNDALSVLFQGPSALFSHSPEDALCLVSIETQNLFRKASLHPGQLAVWISLFLEHHHLFQGRAEHGGTEDGVPGVLDLLYTRLLQALSRHTEELMLYSRADEGQLEYLKDVGQKAGEEFGPSIGHSSLMCC